MQRTPYFAAFLVLILFGAGCKPAPTEPLPTAADLEVEEEDRIVIDDAVCLEEATVLDNGRMQYPIAEEFAHLEFLGQIFTADSCGGAWMEEIMGVENGMYTAGIVLKAKGNTTGIDTAEKMEEIGFTCDEEYEYPEDCTDWRFDGEVSIEDLLRLKHDASEFERDDCISCG